jgi:hypothetical protein
MFRILLLILTLAIGSTAVAQTTEELPTVPKDMAPEAEKILEVEQTTNEHFAALFDSFLSGELEKDPTAYGYIINYGADREVARIARHIRHLVSLRKFSPSRIVIERGGFRRETKTEFWLVRAGVMPPTLEWRPHKIDFFGRITRADFKKRFVNYLVRLREQPTNTGYIIIDGSDAYAAAQEKLIREIMRVRRFMPERITIFRGKVGGQPQTQLWLLPAGATADEIERFRKEIWEYANERGTNKYE